MNPASYLFDELESPESIASRKAANSAVMRMLIEDKTPALVSALRELARHVDEDVPVENRSRHLNNALAYAFELAEAYEETPTHQ